MKWTKSVKNEHVQSYKAFENATKNNDIILYDIWCICAKSYSQLGLFCWCWLMDGIETYDWCAIMHCEYKCLLSWNKNYTYQKEISPTTIWWGKEVTCIISAFWCWNSKACGETYFCFFKTISKNNDRIITCRCQQSQGKRVQNKEWKFMQRFLKMKNGSPVMNMKTLPSCPIGPATKIFLSNWLTQFNRSWCKMLTIFICTIKSHTYMPSNKHFKMVTLSLSSLERHTLVEGNTQMRNHWDLSGKVNRKMNICSILVTYIVNIVKCIKDLMEFLHMHTKWVKVATKGSKTY